MRQNALVLEVIYCISTVNTQYMQRQDVLVQLGYIWRHVSAVNRPASDQQRIVLLRYRQIYIKTETLQRPKHVARYNPVVLIRTSGLCICCVLTALIQ